MTRSSRIATRITTAARLIRIRTRMPPALRIRMIPI